MLQADRSSGMVVENGEYVYYRLEDKRRQVVDMHDSKAE